MSTRPRQKKTPRVRFHGTMWLIGLCVSFLLFHAAICSPLSHCLEDIDCSNGVLCVQGRCQPGSTEGSSAREQQPADDGGKEEKVNVPKENDREECDDWESKTGCEERRLPEHPTQQDNQSPEENDKDTSTTSPNHSWVVGLGGSQEDRGRGVALDEVGNIYITGWFSDKMRVGAQTLTSKGDRDIFVVKLSSVGSYLWAVRAGGSGSDYGYSIATDRKGSLYITGSFSGNAEFGSSTLESKGEHDIFVAKLNEQGQFLWSISAGGTSHDRGYAITVDANDTLYLAGEFSGVAYFDKHSLTSRGGRDMFVASLSLSRAWNWVAQGGSVLEDTAQSITLSGKDRVCTTGIFSAYNTGSPPPATIQLGRDSLTSRGGFDGFVSCLDAKTGDFIWNRQIGSSARDQGRGIVSDELGNLYLTGEFGGLIFFGKSPQGQELSLLPSGSTDIFVASINAEGTWRWAVRAGGSQSDSSNGIAIHPTGAIFVTGFFTDNGDFGEYKTQSFGGSETFVTQLNTLGQFQWVRSGGSTQDEPGGFSVATGTTSVFVVGSFTSNATFGTSSLASSGNLDVFVWKLDL